MSKLAHSHQPTMDLIEARRMAAGDGWDMDDEATRFACELLVPEPFIRDDLANMKPHDVDDDLWLERLCKRYNVSRGVMLARLRLLEDR